MVPFCRLARAEIFAGALTLLASWLPGPARAQDGFEPVISGDTVKMLMSRDLSPGQYTPIKQLSALSCRRSTFDRRPSERDAIIDLQRQAYQAGADALLDTRCRASDTADLLHNCWQSVECIGTAIALSTATGAPESGSGPAIATGSGFVVSAAGHVLTNAHVVEGCESATGQLPTGQFPLTIVNVDKQNDLAILRTEFKLPAVATFRDGKAIRAGENVIVVGFPLQGTLANQMNVTTGTVSALAGISNDSTQLQMTAPVQPGNSGGPLLDKSGNVVGVVVAKLAALNMASQTGALPENVNFAIKAEIARAYLDSRGVDYVSRKAGKTKEVADIGDEARAYTVFISCTIK
jgi:S1-C subfamily serine protease